MAKATQAREFARYPSLAGRTVIVTGGASGIGEGLVRAFAANRARVAFIDIQKQEGEALAASIVAEGAETPVFVHCDLLDIASLRGAIDHVRALLGPAAVLVNNAANDLRQEFDQVAPEEFDRMMGVNLRHVFFAAQAVLPQMRELGFGSIVNLTSTTWMRGVPDLEAYASAKAAIVGLTNSLARKLGRDHIRVNAIAPGLVLTDKQRRLWFGDPTKIEQYVVQQCLPELVMPEDIARMALFLAADDSRLITKQCFIVNAGFY